MRSPLELIYKFHWILPGEAARAAQMPAFLLVPLLASRDIRSVVNLRGEHSDFAWWRRERNACDANAIMHFDAALDSRSLPTRAMLVSLMDAFEAAPQPVLIKCAGGQDRTSLAAALYIIYRKGFPARDEALAQFQAMPYLHLPRRHQRWLKQFPLYAESQAQHRPLAAWIREDYDPHAFAAWLNERGMGGDFKEVYIRPRDRLRQV